MATGTIGQELERRIAIIGDGLARGPAAQAARGLDEVRALAEAHGLRSAASVAHVIGLAVASREHRAMAAGLLPLLSDAVACGRHDAGAAGAYAAACSVRLAG